MSCPVLWPKPHSAPSSDAFAELRPMVSGVSACMMPQIVLHMCGSQASCRLAETNLYDTAQHRRRH